MQQTGHGLPAHARPNHDFVHCGSGNRENEPDDPLLRLRRRACLGTTQDGPGQFGTPAAQTISQTSLWRLQESSCASRGCRGPLWPWQRRCTERHGVGRSSWSIGATTPSAPSRSTRTRWSTPSTPATPSRSCASVGSNGVVGVGVACSRGVGGCWSESGWTVRARSVGRWAPPHHQAGPTPLSTWSNPPSHSESSASSSSGGSSGTAGGGSAKSSRAPSSSQPNVGDERAEKMPSSVPGAVEVPMESTAGEDSELARLSISAKLQRNAPT
mmetsp:Transcript_29259/g.78120  ORF Transcript_29259/g.78120 Transcript_29259/m.78120 type:complete len:271 (+) Transcript_29259:188-1000(+)